MFQCLKYITLTPFKHIIPGSGFVKLSKGDFHVRTKFPTCSFFFLHCLFVLPGADRCI